MAATRSAPAGTTVRFGLLIALAVGVTVLVYLLMMPPGLLFNADAQVRCQVVSGLYIDGADVSPFQAERISEGSQRLRDCLAEYLPLRLPWLVGGLLALCGLAALIYLCLPHVRIRRGRLVPLDLTADPALTAELDALAERAELRVRPTLLVDPANPRTGGLAFGTRRRPYVCLDAGLITRFRTDPDHFRVVVLHEFAHLRNNDVPIAYLTIAVWRAFLVVGLLPFVVVVLDPWLTSSTPFVSPVPLWGGEYLRGAVVIALQVLGLVLVVLLSRNAVLRSREYRADDRMATWLGRSAPREVLASVPVARGRFAAMVQSHPLLSNRIRAVAEPTRLLRPGFWEAVAAGVAIQIAWRTATLAMTTIGQGGPLGMALLQGLWDTGVAIVAVVAGARYAAYRAGCGSRRVLLLLTPLGLTGGLWLGQYVGVFGTTPTLSLLEFFAPAILVVVLTALVWWVGALRRRDPLGGQAAGVDRGGGDGDLLLRRRVELVERAERERPHPGRDRQPDGGRLAQACRQRAVDGPRRPAQRVHRHPGAPDVHRHATGHDPPGPRVGDPLAAQRFPVATRPRRGARRRRGVDRLRHPCCASSRARWSRTRCASPTASAGC